jgi:zinc and cadmium transporter
MNVAFLIPFAAGNFIYIGAADLVPEIKEHKDTTQNIISFLAFIAALALMLIVKLVMGET